MGRLKKIDFVVITNHAVVRLKERCEKNDFKFPEDNLQSFFASMLKSAHKVEKPRVIKLKYSLLENTVEYYKSHYQGWYFASEIRNYYKEDKKFRCAHIITIFRRDGLFGLSRSKRFRVRKRGKKKNRLIELNGADRFYWFPPYDKLLISRVDDVLEKILY